MRIILMRHCETDWNGLGKVQGSTDRELNDEGRAHAHRIGSQGDWDGLTAVYASDLLRAAQTADPIARVANVPVIVDARLRECCFGALEGVSIEEFHAAVRARGGAEERILPVSYEPFGGESSVSVLDRGLASLRTIVASHDADSKVLVVSHGRMIRILIEGLTGISLPHMENGTCFEITFNPGSLRVAMLRRFAGDGSDRAEWLYQRP